MIQEISLHNSTEELPIEAVRTTSKLIHRKTSKLERTAYHEAGHAVAQHELGMAIREVSIIPNVQKKYLGYMASYPQPSFHPDWDLSGKTVNKIQKRIIVLYAGVTTQALFCGWYDWRGAEADMDEAIDLATHAVGYEEELTAYTGWLKLRTRNLIKNRLVWVKVEAVAQALIEKKRLSGKETKQIIRESFARAVEEGWEKLPEPPALLITEYSYRI